jgi:hypothetical protein
LRAIVDAEHEMRMHIDEASHGHSVPSRSPFP